MRPVGHARRSTLATLQRNAPSGRRRRTRCRRRAGPHLRGEDHLPWAGKVIVAGRLVRPAGLPGQVKQRGHPGGTPGRRTLGHPSHVTKDPLTAPTYRYEQSAVTPWARTPSRLPSGSPGPTVKGCRRRAGALHTDGCPTAARRVCRPVLAVGLGDLATLLGVLAATHLRRGPATPCASGPSAPPCGARACQQLIMASTRPPTPPDKTDHPPSLPVQPGDIMDDLLQPTASTLRSNCRSRRSPSSCSAASDGSTARSGLASSRPPTWAAQCG